MTKRKVGLCIGINYATHTTGQLKGCINDATNLQSFLVDIQDYTEVTLLTDRPENKNTSLYPTAYNIIMQLYQLAIRTHLEHIDEAWVSFAGHGTQVHDGNGDEADGKDECILPIDYQTRGVLTDDLLQHVLNMMHPRTKCMVLMDCCHSGTILDLKYTLNDTFECTQIANITMDTQPDVIMISGCQDAQTSADINEEGAMTRAFLDTMSHFDYHLTFRGLIYGMRMHIKERNLTQVPNITMSREHRAYELIIDMGHTSQQAFMSK